MAQCEPYDAEAPVIAAVQSGDRYAFGELMGRHDGWVRAVVYAVLGRREPIDDVMQQVWTAVWQRIGELREPASWRPWLYRLARNAALDAGRRRTRHRRKALSLSAEVEVSAPAHRDGKPDGALMSKEQRQAVLSAIEALPALYREPFVLRHVNGWSYREIADVLDMPVDSVETRLVRARRFLRESLQGRL